MAQHFIAQTVVDAVVIGRNEGARLIACLDTLQGLRRVVYVDSGSTDGSVAAATARGAIVVPLDLTLPFTAARARNAGLDRLRSMEPAPEFVLLLDGDCTLQPDFVAAAMAAMVAHPQVAAVCGRRRERFPTASVYNLSCDLEWDTPVGLADACGGDVLLRCDALAKVGGYDPGFIAGEEPEMCARLRREGWQIRRIVAEMTLHDAAMTRFGQWWRRAVRAGHAFAQVGARHPAVFAPERRRVVIWGLVMPLVALLGMLFVAPWVVLAVLALYAASCARVTWRFRVRGLTVADAAGCALLITLSKFPALQGMATYHWRRLRGDALQLIEYK